MAIFSPNQRIEPLTYAINEHGHLMVGGCDTVELAEKFGTPLWVLDEKTIVEAAASVVAGLNGYPKAHVLYAGKAFLCLAMCHLVKHLGLGLDVVSFGELYTAEKARFPASLIYMHGNNKSKEEITAGLQYGDVKIVVDNESELSMVASIAEKMQRQAKVLLRVTPGVEPNTHHYIRTGQIDSKFGVSLVELGRIAALAKSHQNSIELLGLHAHIGSQAHELEPYLEIVDILADCFYELRRTQEITLSQLDLGGGIGIAYTDSDKPLSMFEWARAVSTKVTKSFKAKELSLPTLLLEPGRAIVGTAGITLYKAGHVKEIPGGSSFLAVDGGMADNPRPITYQARYTPCIANRMRAPKTERPQTIVGRYCESGDIIVKDAYLAATANDIIAIFGTGAYNYSMASNYNRTGRPACVLVSDGKAEIIIKRESNADLIQHDIVPQRLVDD